MLRTWLPTASTAAHTSRVEICAVAGIAMPPDELCSPSSRDIRTRTRSCSILIGNRSVTRYEPSVVRRRERPSAPAELVQAFLVDAEVVADLVDDRDGDLAGNLLLVRAGVDDRQPKQGDRVGQRERVVAESLGQRDAVIDAQQRRLVRITIR